MRIAILNGSPRKENTAAMIEANFVSLISTSQPSDSAMALTISISMPTISPVSSS